MIDVCQSIRSVHCHYIMIRMTALFLTAQSAQIFDVDLKRMAIQNEQLDF